MTATDIGRKKTVWLQHPSTPTGRIVRGGLEERLARKILVSRSWKVTEHTEDKEITFQVSKKQLGP